MSEYSSRNRLILVKEETTAGVDAVPTPAANAIRLQTPASTPNLSTVDPNEDTGALDGGAAVPTTATMSFTARALMRGSGTPGTVAPPVTPFLKAAGWGMAATAADVTGTPTAGTISTLTLAAGSSAIDDFYKGMPIQITAGANSGTTRVISGYVGSTKVATVTPPWTITSDATSTYAIRKNHLFSPISSGIPTLTVYDYGFRRDGGLAKLTKLLGGSVALQLNMAVSELCYFDITLTSMFTNDTDVTAPAAGTFASTNPIALQSALVGHLDGVLLKLRNISVDMGNQVTQVQNIHAPFGLDVGVITARNITGTMSSPRLLQAERDVVTSWQNGTPSRFGVTWGAVAGNRFSLLLDRIVYTGKAPEEVNNLIYESTPFSIDGINSGVYFCFW